MTELQRLTHKLQRETEILRSLVDRSSAEPTERALALSRDQSKRVRRVSNMLVRALAEAHDNHDSTA